MKGLLRRCAQTAVLAGVLGLPTVYGFPSFTGQSVDPGQTAGRLHEDAIVVDGHVHITNRVYWEGIDPWQTQTTGSWDYARAKQGGLDVAIAQVLIEDGYNNYNVAVKQACRLIETFHRVLEANRDQMELAFSSADVRRIAASGKLAVILALEGGFDMEGDLDVLRLFHRLGVRLIQFTSHDTTNAYVDAGLGEQKWGGITDHGRALVREMNRLGIIIDIAHASDAAQLQIIEASHAPVAASHHGLRRFTQHPRSISDEVLKALAAKGGVVGIHSNVWFLDQTWYEWWLARPQAARPAPTLTPGLPNMFRSPDEDYGTYMADLDAATRAAWVQGYTTPWKEKWPADAPPPLTEADWANSVDYAVKLVGADHVGIGLDMMDGGRNLHPNFDATSYPRLTEALVAKDLAPDVIRKVIGENWLRLLDSALNP